jgi:branched-chain amino acid transport system substrate-binding protein
LILIKISCASVFAQSYNLYLEADQTVFKASGQSIKKGVEAAIEFYRVRNPDSKLEINFKSLDHKGNTRRSLLNFQKIAADPKAIAVLGGLHSPPLITNNQYINEQQILTLVPWAAGGPITRGNSLENWFFRLSLDDTQVGGYIAKYAITKQNCKNPFLLLENTPWGRSNEKNMKSGLKKFGESPADIQFFDWGVSKSASLKIANRVKKSKAGCIFFVGNGKDAKNLFSSLFEEKVTLPVLSHWGITGGDNREMAKIIRESHLDLQVVQTKFSFLNPHLTKFQKEVMNFIMKKNNFSSSREIEPMSGWVHSFDLTLIFMSVLERVGHEGDIRAVRKKVKQYFESKELNVQGLIKKYQRTFFPQGEVRNFHEALSDKDYVMRVYQEDGTLY